MKKTFLTYEKPLLTVMLQCQKMAIYPGEGIWLGKQRKISVSCPGKLQIPGQ